MRHGTLTIITRVRRSPRALRRLRSILAGVARDPTPAFGQVPGLHFARWALLDRDPDDGERRLEDIHLVFAADFGGEGRGRALLSDFIGRLVDGQAGGNLLSRVYRCCEGFPERASPEALKAYLLRHLWGYEARHVGFAYRATSVDGVREALRLADDARAWLNARRSRDVDPDAFARALRARHAALFAPDIEEGLRAARRSAAWATLAYPLVHPLLLLARRARGLVGKPPPAAGAMARRIRASERRIAPDAPAQNPMVHVASLELDPVRLAVFRLLLRCVNLRMKRYLVGLNHITTIHCARWTIFRTAEGRRRVLFLSNYDGSWDAYIGSFLDSPDVGGFLDLMWSQTKDFPGIADPAAFMDWLEARQLPTTVWHSAYRDLGERSIAEIQQALRLRALIRDGDRAGLEHYLEAGACEPEPMLHSLRSALTELIDIDILRRRSARRDERAGRTEHVERREPIAIPGQVRAALASLAPSEAHAAQGA